MTQGVSFSVAHPPEPAAAAAGGASARAGTVGGRERSRRRRCEDGCLPWRNSALRAQESQLFGTTCGSGGGGGGGSGAGTTRRRRRPYTHMHARRTAGSSRRARTHTHIFIFFFFVRACVRAEDGKQRVHNNDHGAAAAAATTMVRLGRVRFAALRTHTRNANEIIIITRYFQTPIISLNCFPL